MDQEVYGNAKNMIKQDAYMKFYDVLKSLYLETDASGINLQGWPPTGKRWHEL